MIRFVDIRNQGIGLRFAFWDTVTDSFINIDGEQAWDSWDEFEEFANEAIVNRYRTLCPGWVFDGKQDDLNSWYKNA